MVLASASTLVTSLWFGLGALALVGTLFLLASAMVQRARQRGWVVVSERGIARVDKRGRETTLARFGQPFGALVLANHARTQAVLAFTTPEHTRFIPIRAAASEADAMAAREVITFAATVADADLMQRGEGALAPTDAAALLRAIRERAPSSLGRVFLTGAAGDELVLEDRELRCARVGEGERMFDLRSPVEWKGFLFHESLGSVAMVYQATWIRQGTSELVVVAPLPPEISVGRRKEIVLEGGALRGQASFLRDLKLMQSAPDQPPPRELRFAIERVFMLPLRQALDRAPRASRPSLPRTRLSSAHG